MIQIFQLVNLYCNININLNPMTAVEKTIAPFFCTVIVCRYFPQKKKRAIIALFRPFCITEF